MREASAGSVHSAESTDPAAEVGVSILVPSVPMCLKCRKVSCTSNTAQGSLGNPEKRAPLERPRSQVVFEVQEGILHFKHMPTLGTVCTFLAPSVGMCLKCTLPGIGPFGRIDRSRCGSWGSCLET